MSGWRLLVEIFLPIPLVLLFFLSLPFPKFFRRTVLRLTNNVMSLPLIGGLQLVHVMLCITGVALAAMTKNTLINNRFSPPADTALSANQRQHYLGQKWRNERNFWIAALSFMSWWGLFCFYKASHKRVELEEENQKLKDRLSAYESFQNPGDPQNAEESEVTEESKKDD
ncbi:hypothetical protein BSKO_09952 [Bryopsis sp. KO-2023]|nr:hypothetical protein BSKO_09952 [Bryopsis sp. KO-2023]